MSRRRRTQAAVLARRWHRRLAMVIGIQVLLWTFSGVYMVLVDIDIIHGDMLVEESTPQLLQPVGLLSPLTLLARYPDTQSLRLEHFWNGDLVYVLETTGGDVLVDATSGAQKPTLSEGEVRTIAQQLYAGTNEIKSVTYLTELVPAEVGFLRAPLWAVSFEDYWGSTFYIAADSGALLSRRHTLWRVFDFLWMLHIMDYGERENVNNLLLTVASGTALLFVLAGIWLLYFNLRGPRRRATS